MTKSIGSVFFICLVFERCRSAGELPAQLFYKLAGRRSSGDPVHSLVDGEKSIVLESPNLAHDGPSR